MSMYDTANVAMDQRPVWETTLKGLEEAAPAFIYRRDLGQYSGGILHPRTEANRDSAAKKDPSIPCIPGRCVINNRVAYPAAAVFAHLRRLFSTSSPKIPPRGRPTGGSSAMTRLTGQELLNVALSHECSAPDNFLPETRMAWTEEDPYPDHS